MRKKRKSLETNMETTKKRIGVKNVDREENKSKKKKKRK